MILTVLTPHQVFLLSLNKEKNDLNYNYITTFKMFLYPKILDEVTSVSWDVFIELLPAITPREGETCSGKFSQLKLILGLLGAKM